MILIFSACKSDNSEKNIEVVQTTPTPTESVAPKDEPLPKKTRMSISMNLPKTLNPLLNEDETVSDVLKIIFEPLYVLDETMKPVPNLAQAATLSEDGLSATLTLKDNLFWHDGERISAHDVAFSIDMLKGAGNTTIYSKNTENIASYTVITENVISLKFSKVNSAYLYDLCFPIIPRHYYLNETDKASAVNMTPIGSGFYRFEKYNPSQNMLLIASGAGLKPSPITPEINVLVVPNKEASIYSFNENITNILNANMKDWAKYKNDKPLNKKEYVSDHFDFIGFNFDKETMQDKRIRKAIAQSINIEELLDTIYLNQAVRAYTPINPTSWAFEINTFTYEFDLEAAKALFQEASFKQTTPLIILVNEENETRVKIANILSENLKKIHVIAAVKQVSFEEYKNELLRGNFDLYIGGYVMGAKPDLSFAFHSERIPANITDSGKNVSRYKNPIMDALFGIVDASTTITAHKANLSQLQQFISEELPCVSIAFHKNAIFTDKSIKGDLAPTLDNPFGTIYNLGTGD